MKVTELKVGDILLPTQVSGGERLWSWALGRQPQEAAIVLSVNTVDQWAVILRAGTFEPVLDIIDGRLYQCHVLRPYCSSWLKEHVHLWLVREARKAYSPFRFVLNRCGLRLDVTSRVATMADLIVKAYAVQEFNVAPNGKLHNTESSEWIY